MSTQRQAGEAEHAKHRGRRFGNRSGRIVDRQVHGKNGDAVAVTAVDDLQRIAGIDEAQVTCPQIMYQSL